MEFAPTITQDTAPSDELQAKLRTQRARCLASNCILQSQKGCPLEGILELKKQLYLAEPCSDAVARLPHRQKQKIAA